ncbi:phosphatase PAP2 family protein [Corynebacterium sp. AOP40-9SA-29]|uniref:phosphatase PAP2 family protein n=1 Tax=Corynebacterium sp. AOP40-9SA-29 TaxID=3457677 RepID=UPI004034943B
MTEPAAPVSRRVLCAAGAALLLYTVLWAGWVHHWTWVDVPDARALDAAQDMAARHGWWVTAWNTLSTVLGPAVWRVLVIIPVGLALYRRDLPLATFLAASVWGGGLLSQTAKHLADRDRPVTRMVEASGTSFPSGHALGVLVAVGALLIAYRHLAGRCQRAAGAGGVLLVLLVGVSRVALNVHHPSDVLAGWALGFAWLVLCLVFYRLLARGRYTGSTR